MVSLTLLALLLAAGLTPGLAGVVALALVGLLVEV